MVVISVLFRGEYQAVMCPEGAEKAGWRDFSNALAELLGLADVRVGNNLTGNFKGVGVSERKVTRSSGEGLGYRLVGKEEVWGKVRMDLCCPGCGKTFVTDFPLGPLKENSSGLGELSGEGRREMGRGVENMVVDQGLSDAWGGFRGSRRVESSCAVAGKEGAEQEFLENVQIRSVVEGDVNREVSKPKFKFQNGKKSVGLGPRSRPLKEKKSVGFGGFLTKGVGPFNSQKIRTNGPHYGFKNLQQLQ